MANENEMFVLDPKKFMDAMIGHTANGTLPPESLKSAPPVIDPAQQFLATLNNSQSKVGAYTPSQVQNVSTGNIGTMLQDQTLRLQNSNQTILDQQAQALTQVVDKITAASSAEIDLAVEKKRLAQQVEDAGFATKAEAELQAAQDLVKQREEILKRQETFWGAFNPMNDIRERALAEEIQAKYANANTLFNGEAALVQASMNDLARSEANLKAQQTASQTKASVEVFGTHVKQADEQRMLNAKTSDDSRNNLLSTYGAKESAAARAEAARVRREAASKESQAENQMLMVWESRQPASVGMTPEQIAEKVKAYTPEQKSAYLGEIRFSAPVSQAAAENTAVNQQQQGFSGLAEMLTNLKNVTITSRMKPDTVRQLTTIVGKYEPQAMALFAKDNNLQAGDDVAKWNSLSETQKAVYLGRAHIESSKLNLGTDDMNATLSRLAASSEETLKKLRASTNPNDQKKLKASADFDALSLRVVSSVLKESGIDPGETIDQKKLVKGIDKTLQAMGYAGSASAKIRHQIGANILANMAKARYYAQVPVGQERTMFGVVNPLPIYNKDNKALDMSRPENFRLIAGSGLWDSVNEFQQGFKPVTKESLGGPIKQLLEGNPITPADSLNGPLLNMLNGQSSNGSSIGDQAGLFGFGSDGRPTQGTPVVPGPIIRG